MRVVVAIRSAGENGIADELQDCAVRYGDARYFSISAVGVEGVVLIEGAEEGSRAFKSPAYLKTRAPYSSSTGMPRKRCPTSKKATQSLGSE